MNELAVIVTGNPIDGLQFYGPFDTLQDAIAFANTDPHMPDEWWTAPLHAVSANAPENKSEDANPRGAD
jgi:hypothetical protein